MQRAAGSLDWVVEEPELIKYAIDIAELWLQRELTQKGRLTADHLNKACGILSEEIFSAELNELDIPHIRTVPLFNKLDPTNAGKHFDFKINNYTIDIKSISPLPPRSGHHKNINVNSWEVGDHLERLCDYYIGTKCFPEMLMETAQTLKDDNPIPKDLAFEALSRVKNVRFIGYITGKELCSPRNFVSYYNFYSAKPPHKPISELALLLKIPLESGP